MNTALKEIIDKETDIERLRDECLRMHRYVSECLAYPPWPIAASEQLPPIGSGVLAYINDGPGRQAGWQCLERDGERSWTNTDTVWLTGDDFDNVTHWLPMPPKP